jgi:peptidoglycan/LPS O-acetylase OafA/YrhL
MGLWIPFFARATQPVPQPAIELPRGHIPALDGIRGLAILLVTIYRFAGTHDYSTPAWLLPALEFGTRGVDLFFVLSGFLITGILFDAKGESHYFRNFYARRTLRIFPLYYGTLILVLFLLPPAGLSQQSLKLPATDVNSLWVYGSNVVMSWRGEWHFGALNHFWSLCIEEHFYLVWPFVIAACSRVAAMRICAAAFCLSAGARIGWLVLGGNGVAAEVFTLFRLDALCAGAWIALAARRPSGLGWLVPRARWVALGTGLLLLPIIALSIRLKTVPTTLFAVFFAAFIVLAVASSKQGLLSYLGKSALLQWLGRYSYGMYVYQNLLLVALAGLFTPAIIENATGSALLGRSGFMVIMSLLTVGIAWISWHLFEKRCLAFKHYFAGSHAGASATRTPVAS